MNVKDDWYHRNPCHDCPVCGEHGCWVFSPGDGVPEVHVCADGCDGTPWGAA